jgi:hypothetical protein
MSCNRALLVAFFLIAIPHALRGDERSLKDEFIAAYRKPASQLEQFYRNIDLSETPVGKWATLRYGEKATLRWRSSGNRFRDDYLDGTGSITRSHLWLGDVKCAIKRVGVNRSANIATNPGIADGQAHFALTSVTDVKSRDPLSVDHTESPRLAFAAYCIHDEPILVFVKRGNVSVASFDDGDPKNATVKLDVLRENGHVSHETLVFNKELGWALEKDQYIAGGTEVEYGDSVSGIPLVKSLKYWQEGNFKEAFFTSTIKEIIPGPPPDSIFSTAEFGIPELPGWSRRTEFPILTTLGLIGLGIALVLSWVAYRRRRVRQNA